MHELPVTESILKVVLKYAAANNVSKVVSVKLEVGKLSDLADEWIQRYCRGREAENRKDAGDHEVRRLFNIL